MFDEGNDLTPVYPFEYDHLLFNQNDDLYTETEENSDATEENVYQHETYHYL